MFDYDAELRRYHRRLLPAMNVRPDDQVLDIGCGTGLTTRAAGEEAVSALGVDISAEMVATARKLSQHLPNVSFEQADVQHHQFPAGQFSLAVSRFGTMFFTDPVAAFTNIAGALRPGARLVQLVWQDETHQEWYAEIRRTLADTQATAGHAAFSLADPATTERVLADAGFTDVQLLDVREPVYYGADVEAALDSLRSLQMAQGSDRDIDRLRAMLETHLTADGIWFGSRAWIVTAHRR